MSSIQYTGKHKRIPLPTNRVGLRVFGSAEGTDDAQRGKSHIAGRSSLSVSFDRARKRKAKGNKMAYCRDILVDLGKKSRMKELKCDISHIDKKQIKEHNNAV